MEKLLSIIVPSYNMEKYLPKCLGSLVGIEKSYLDLLDVIVVNDGSKDRTSEIAHDFERRYPGVFRVIDKPNGNYGSCINAALPVLLGKYVKVLDADDWFDKESFSAYLNALSKVSGVELVLTDFDSVDGSGEVIEKRRCGFSPNEPFPIGEFLHVGITLSMHAFTYRTDIFGDLAYRQLEGVSYTDTEWISFPLLKVRRVLYLPISVYRYVLGRTGQTMEADTVARNWWMFGQIGLDMLKQLPTRSEVAEDPVCVEIERRARCFIVSAYRTGIYGYKSADQKRLRDFDSTVRQFSQSLYDSLDNVSYSRIVPYRFIRAWRAETRLLPIMLAICTFTSAVANAFRRFSNGRT